MTKKFLPVRERFMLYVEKTDGCWLWKGRKNGGYGSFTLSPGNNWLAHRLSYYLFAADIPAGLNVLHRCDVRACVNPSHLFVGTHKDNTQDAIAKGRLAVGERNGLAKATEQTVRGIRAEYTGARGDLARLARKHNLAGRTIKKIVARVTWKHIE
jgi:hypothetical protein